MNRFVLSFFLLLTLLFTTSLQITAQEVRIIEPPYVRAGWKTTLSKRSQVLGSAEIIDAKTINIYGLSLFQTCAAPSAKLTNLQTFESYAIPLSTAQARATDAAVTAVTLTAEQSLDEIDHLTLWCDDDSAEIASGIFLAPTAVNVRNVSSDASGLPYLLMLIFAALALLSFISLQQYVPLPRHSSFD